MPLLYVFLKIYINTMILPVYHIYMYIYIILIYIYTYILVFGDFSGARVSSGNQK